MRFPWVRMAPVSLVVFACAYAYFDIVNVGSCSVVLTCMHSLSYRKVFQVKSVLMDIHHIVVLLRYQPEVVSAAGPVWQFFAAALLAKCVVLS